METLSIMLPDSSLHGRADARERRPRCASAAVLLFVFLGVPAVAAEPKPGERLERRGDEIVVCGQLFHTTTPVVLWTDPGGYDAYRVERRFAPWDKADWDETKREAPRGDLGSPNRFSLRRVKLDPAQLEQVRGGGWDLAALQKVVDQFVIHFDVEGTSRRCFETLHDKRGLSVQFMLDLDGTLYQTLDLKEGAWHATKANSHSIGIEIANVGAYPEGEKPPFDQWYHRDPDGQVRLVLPESEVRWQRTLRNDPSRVLRPSRPEPIEGMIHGKKLVQYDFTPQQYDALIRLTATLCTVFPQIKCDYPRDASGALLRATLPAADYNNYHGLLGHFHVQTNKVDPGPAFQWDMVVNKARALMKAQ